MRKYSDPLLSGHRYRDPSRHGTPQHPDYPRLARHEAPHPFSPAASPASYRPLLQLPHPNFMGGCSFAVNPLQTLRLITASSIFGEPQYYRSSGDAEAGLLNGMYGLDRIFARFSLAVLDPYQGMTTTQVMLKAIDDALDYDYAATLDWAVELRETYLMRRNPQIIMVRASQHPARVEFTRKHPGKFGACNRRVMARGDDVITQFCYWLSWKGSKQGIPAVLKRSWASRIGEMNAYTVAKYHNRGGKLIDVVRVCHAKGEVVDELMQTGTVQMPAQTDTWERLRASGKSWSEILTAIRMPHMALLRNLRGILAEVRHPALEDSVLELLCRGVKGGKQFPFRYFTARQALEAAGYRDRTPVQQALERCMDLSCDTLPTLAGRSAFLTDNSGSAWGACPSEWGTMRVAEIGNLSSVIGAMRAQEGVVFPFGDRLEEVPIQKDLGVLKQAEQVSLRGQACGPSTENGIWLFFRDAIRQKQHWDNIFVYSDMQAGHGGLFGISPEEYAKMGCSCGRYIDVAMLVQRYRDTVNPKVNVFCIQTAGYPDALIPEYGYRTAILTGWTGKELIFADALNKIWDDIEA